jgi:hypothetical protein
MMKIRDIYQISLKEVQSKYALDIWYTNLINKTVSEIDTNDMCKMIKQNIFKELAINKAIDVLELNPLTGDVYDGQLLELLFSDGTEIIKAYKERLSKLLMETKENLDIDDFICEEDCNQFRVLVEKFLTKLNS